MASTKSNVRKFKPQPQLTDTEVERISERLASALEHDGDNIALVTLLFDHIERQKHIVDVVNAIYGIKKRLFIGLAECDNARDQFQADAYANRGKLLRWPNEGSAK